MREKLLQLLKTQPEIAKYPSEAVDTLADDLQASIIRFLYPSNFDEPDADLEQAVDEVWLSDFGVHFFNMYSLEDFPGKKALVFSARKRVVKAAIEALLVEQCIDAYADVADAPQLLENVTDGNMLKRRLRELSAEPPTGLPN